MTKDRLEKQINFLIKLEFWQRLHHVLKWEHVHKRDIWNNKMKIETFNAFDLLI